jgi:hypothetical protein
MYSNTVWHVHEARFVKAKLCVNDRLSDILIATIWSLGGFF